MCVCVDLVGVADSVCVDLVWVADNIWESASVFGFGLGC